MSCEDLRRVSDLSRGGLLQSISSSGDPQLDEELYAATMKEVKKGFIVGPLDLCRLRIFLKGPL